MVCDSVVMVMAVLSCDFSPCEDFEYPVVVRNAEVCHLFPENEELLAGFLGFLQNLYQFCEIPHGDVLW